MLDRDGTNASPPPDAAAEPREANDAARPAEDAWPALAYWTASSQVTAPPSTEPGPSSDAAPPPAQVTPPAEPAPPAPPAWTKSYELPTARSVVGAGLHLAATSSKPIRQASLYIGLLALGAFGPTVVLLLLWIGRLMSDPQTAATMASDPMSVLFEQPDIVGPLLLVYCLLIVGVVLLLAISIDAQAIAIALLGGTASERPLRLSEAVTRARQVFWRLAGAGVIVGIASWVISFVVAIPFVRPFDTNTGITFVASMIGTLVVTPFAFAATGIVLGDVGAIEALQRSIRLFQARPRIALVVVLFTLVTSAIQTFAIGAGLDIAVRVADFLHIGLDQGGLGLILPAVLVLGFIMAFGSLTFTIAAIVAAPQVAAFLGLTFYSGGLDRARVDAGGAPAPRRFRWVTLPMLASMLGLVAVAGLGLPSIAAFQPRPASALLQILRTAATDHGVFVSTYGSPNMVEDPPNDVTGRYRPSTDLVSASFGYLPEVPDWLLADLFDCAAATVVCGDAGSAFDPFADGAYLFAQRMAGPPGVEDDRQVGQWGPVVVMLGHETKPHYGDDPVSGASHAILTRMDAAGGATLHLFVASDSQYLDQHTYGRSTWIGDDLLTIVPLLELDSEVVEWDASAAILYSTPGHDSLRATASKPLLTATVPELVIYFSPEGVMP